MGEYIRVVCKGCKDLLDEVWSEDTDHLIVVKIDGSQCRCIADMTEDAFANGYETGYEEGVIEGKEHPDE